MTLFISRSRALLASAAALSLVASPVMAQGWHGGWGHRHRDNDDTGAWIVGGIIGIGMIAAIASAASKGKRDRETREREGGYDRGYDRGEDYRRDDYRYGSRSDGYGDRQSGSPRGIDGAVDRCVSEVERGSTRVDTVDSVNRDANGWRVTGRIGGGQGFDCSIDSDGRIRGVNIQGRSSG